MGKAEVVAVEEPSVALVLALPVALPPEQVEVVRTLALPVEALSVEVEAEVVDPMVP